MGKGASGFDQLKRRAVKMACEEPIPKPTSRLGIQTPKAMRPKRLNLDRELPTNPASHRRIALPVGVRQSITFGRGGATHRRQRAGMETQSIAEIVESQDMSQLHINQGHDMAPRLIGATVLLH